MNAAVATRLDLLRHGEPEGGARLRGRRCDDRLTAAGHTALVATTRDLGGWDRIASSPLARCRTFAEALAGERGCPLDIDDRLAEYDFGDWDGQPFERLWAERGDALAAFFGDPDALVPPNGEAAADFRARVRAAFDDLVASARGGHVLVVGHGGVLRQFVADALGLAGNAHARLEWPHAALTGLRVVDDPETGRSVSLVFHGSTASGIMGP